MSTWEDDPIEICAVCWRQVVKYGDTWEHKDHRANHDVALVGDSVGIKLRVVPS